MHRYQLMGGTIGWAVIVLTVVGMEARAAKDPPLIQTELAKPAPNKTAGSLFNQVRHDIVGDDRNRPDHFLGLGDFIVWPGDIVRLNDGELMFVHSAGNGHASFATPVVLTEAVQKRYFQWHLYLEHAAPDGRANWSPPICVGPDVDGYGKLFLMKDETMPVSHIHVGVGTDPLRSGSSANQRTVQRD